MHLFLKYNALVVIRTIYVVIFYMYLLIPIYKRYDLIINFDIKHFIK